MRYYDSRTITGIYVTREWATAGGDTQHPLSPSAIARLQVHDMGGATRYALQLFRDWTAVLQNTCYNIAWCAYSG